MNKTMEKIKSEIEEKYFLTLGKDNMDDNYSSEPDLGKCVDNMIDAFYLNNSPQGKLLYHIKKDYETIQKTVLGDKADELDSTSNPIILKYDGQTKIYKDKHSIDSNEENYEQLLLIANNPIFKNNDSIALVNKDTSLVDTYIQTARQYNQTLNSCNHNKEGFSLWLSDKIYSDLEKNELFNQKLKGTIANNPNAWKVYKALQKIEDEKGHLTALRATGIKPENSKNYLSALVSENNDDEYKLLIAQKIGEKIGNDIFCISDSEEIKQPVIALNGLAIRNLSQNQFKNELYLGNITLNDLVLEGVELKDNPEFNSIKESYQNHSFNENQIQTMSKRAMHHLGLANKSYQNAAAIEMKMRQNNPANNNEMAKMNNMRINSLFDSLKNCVDGLKYQAFSLKYEENLSTRFTSSKMFSNPENDIQTMVANYAQAYHNLARKPGSIRSDDIFKVIYQAKEMMLRDDINVPNNEKIETNEQIDEDITQQKEKGKNAFDWI